MSQAIKIVAQTAMDDFYQNYKGASDFFAIDDFIYRCGAAIGTFFKDQFDVQRAEMRSEKKDEVVAFSHDWLNEIESEVDKENKIVLTKAFMSFPFDRQNSGIQEVLPVNPLQVQLERSNLAEIWQLQYTPNSNVIFWYIDRKTIRFVKKGVCNVKKVRILYVPGIGADMEIPDSLVDYAIITTVAKMKEIANGVVVKKSLDGNQNKILQSEINTQSLK